MAEAYRFVADRVVELDAINPQVASRIVSSFNQWKRFEPGRAALMKAELERIARQSRDLEGCLGDRRASRGEIASMSSDSMILTVANRLAKHPLSTSSIASSWTASPRGFAFAI